MINRNRTPSKYIAYGLYLYFSGLSLRRTSERLAYFIRRNHVSIWNWIQKYHPRKIISQKRRISEFIVDETLLQVGSEYVWLWVAIESELKIENSRTILANKSKERNMFVAERFLSNIVGEYGTHPVSPDGGTWYPQACRFLKLDHHIHSFFAKKEKSLIERTMQ